MARVVLLTGASSFTGLWIAEALAGAGWSVVAPLRRASGDYGGVRGERVARLSEVAEVAFETPFGSPGFLDLVRARRPEALGHHAADVTDYRSPDFDAAAAFGRNTEGALCVLKALAEAGTCAVLATGTVFEAGEGGDPARSEAVTPYGLSKTLTNIALAHFAAWTGLSFARFVIPSPYGVLEEPRFGWYLFRTWAAGGTPVVRTPLYVRDHLAAPRLASAYVAALEAMVQGARRTAFRPSGWIASQGAFGEKVAREAGARLGRALPIELARQTALEEPHLRVNCDAPADPAWDEARFWDDYVDWYERLRREGALG
jgi:nucleoside-diphosphate-sugar epimerase